MNKKVDIENIVKDYIKKYLNDKNELTISKKKLGELLHKDYPHIFPNVEYARGRIRRATFSGAGRNSKTGMVVTNKFSQKNQWNLPEEAETIDTSPFIIPVKHSPSLCLADIHFPYHDKQALESSLEWGYKNECKSVFLNGDIIDFYECSTFLKDPRKRQFQEEIEMLYDFMLTLSKNFKHVYYKLGNHDERYYKYLFKNAPIILKSKRVADALELDSILKLSEMGNVTMIKDKRLVKMGDLNVIHGHEYGKDPVFSPVNAARGYFIKTLDYTLVSHRHQSSYNPGATIQGKVLACWSTGCLCKLNPEYAPFNKWNHGCARTEWQEDGNFEVDNKTIKKGKML